MPYEFTERPYKAEPQPSAQMGRRPPGTYTAAGVLDPGESSPSGPRHLTLAEMLRFTVILMGGGAVAALIAYLVSLLALK